MKNKRFYRSIAMMLALVTVLGMFLVATFAAETATVAKWNVTLTDDLRVNFYLSIPKGAVSNTQVKLTVGDGLPTTSNVGDMTVNGDGYYTVSAHIAAAQMTDNINVVIVTDGVEVVNNNYTVANYANSVLKNSNMSRFHELVRNMLNYGAKAQAYFAYNTDAPANAGNELSEQPAVTTEEKKIAVEGTVSGILLNSTSLLFRNKIAMRFYFSAPNGVKGYTFKVDDVSYEPQAKDDLYYVQINGINPSDYNTDVTLTVSDGTDSLKVTYSPMHYITRMYNKASASESLKELLSAMYGYYLTACNLPDISLTTEEDIYALGRLLSPDPVKRNSIANDPSYNIEDDFDRFEIPNTLTTDAERIEYLQNASFILAADVALTLQDVNNAGFFLGIGSSEYPFKGKIIGNNKTITLYADSALSLDGDCNYGTGLFGTTDGAELSNIDLQINSDIVIARSVNKVALGGIVGHTLNTEINHCTVTINDACIGVHYLADEEHYGATTWVGAMAGESKKSIYNHCNVYLNNASVFAKGKDIETEPTLMYAMFSVGGIIGFSSSGCQNVSDPNAVGKLGNQLYNCNVVSENKTQQDVIAAYVETGEELTAGGLVGCTFNNFVAKNCSVHVTNGNIVAAKTGASDIDSTYGTQVGGIIGRLEHTGEIYNCHVVGDHLNILSKSPENYSAAGGIVGVDMGPYHRNVVSVNKCSFEGSGTSTITIEIAASDEVNKFNSVGGIVGEGTYRIVDCSVMNTTISNQSIGVVKSFTGGIIGLYHKRYGMFAVGQFFTPDAAEILGYTTTNIVFDVFSGAKYKDICGFTE